jgi:hypothetical protein
MKPWPKYPVIYEINSWVWLNELSRKYNRSVTLSSVPEEEWDFPSSLERLNNGRPAVSAEGSSQHL